MSALCEWLELQGGVRPIAVVGVGNRLRGDDAAGSLVAERLRAAGYAPVYDAETVPENYLGALLGVVPGMVLFVDALDHGGASGSLRLAAVDELAPRLTSTHAPSLAMLARLLERRGIPCGLLGIQPESTAPGLAPSPAVARAIDEVVDALAGALEREANRV
jgi:hydrogenase 3 maturation protease